MVKRSALSVMLPAFRPPELRDAEPKGTSSLIKGEHPASGTSSRTRTHRIWAALASLGSAIAPLALPSPAYAESLAASGCFGEK